MERKTVYNMAYASRKVTGGISIAGDKISDIRRPGAVLSLSPLDRYSMPADQRH
jgi:hypothetical protein